MGGPMSESEMAEYRASPHAEAATALRRFDEGAKVEGLETPPVEHFFPYVNACLEPVGR
jgi:[1-hydroxy-2-(trimethylamino)ethyl]phosphonate dioxygenase